MTQGLLQDIWEKEEISTEWKTGHIVKLLMKGDFGDCHKKNTTETNSRGHQGAEMAIGWAHPTTGSILK